MHQNTYTSKTLLGNWYDGRLDPTRDSATFISARESSCPLAMEGAPTPSQWTTTNKAHFTREAHLAALAGQRAVQKSYKFINTANMPQHLAAPRDDAGARAKFVGTGMYASEGALTVTPAGRTVFVSTNASLPVLGAPAHDTFVTSTHTAFGGPYAAHPDSTKDRMIL